jgi:hypothetical protein
MKLRLVSIALALGVLALVFGSLEPIAAQGQGKGPDVFGSPKNLQVLPKDIDSQTLRGYMVGAAQGLGVRCWACHVGEEGQDLSTFDFVSDEKPMKLVAREMFKMTLQINQTQMPAVAKLLNQAEPERVRCVTCHRGASKPTYEQK